MDRASEESGRAMAARLGEQWTTLIDWRGVLLLSHQRTPASRLDHGRGVVLGEVYEKTNGALANFTDDMAGNAKRLARQCWGAYVAVLVDRGHDVLHVLRDSTGAAPCYRAGGPDLAIFFSHAGDFVGMRPDGAAPDLDFVDAFLRHPKVASRRTGLQGVEEICPGEHVQIGRDHERRDRVWTPTEPPMPETPTFETGARALRETTSLCVAARTMRAARVTHRLSGGFDSAVVLALVAQTRDPATITCVNEFWGEAAEGDERAQARLVAQRFGVTLIEMEMNPRRVRYERTLAAPLTVRPTLSALGHGDPETIQNYASHGGDVLTSGQGGDHVFHRSRTAAIAADALRDGVAGAKLLQIALDTARLTRRSVWGVFEAMIEGGVLRMQPRLPHANAAPGVLARDASSPLEPHPWMGAARKLSPARAMRIWHLLDAMSYHDPSALNQSMDCAPVLLSQPIIETCLAIAPYVMTADGRERALARAAFADLIPPEVLARATKGETTRYFAAILASNAAFIRDLLIDGELVDAGLVSRARLTERLTGDWRQDGLVADGIYALLSAEIWLRNLKRDIAAAAAVASAA